MTLNIDNPDKIGIGTWDFDSSGTALSHVEAVQFGWYYNWRGDALWDSSGGTDTLTSEFVPTIWGRDEVDTSLLDRIASSSADTLLGFNEPDNKSQADMSVEEALSLWPDLMATGLRLGSPAPTTEHAVGENSWLGRFMEGAEQKGYRVDFIAVHYYNDDMDVGAFKAHLEAVYEAYGRPVWVTEWALVDWENPDRFTQEEISAFALEAIHMMDDLPFVERHAWFGAYEGGDGWHINTELFDSDGQLTAVGDVFASAIGGVANDLQIAGTDGDDTLYGNGGDDELSGGSGDDVMHGRAGNDTLDGGAGNDTLYGGAGSDIIAGGWGGDTLLGGDGNDVLYGGIGGDRVYGEGGDDFLVGGPGTDLLAGGDGDDTLLGGSENDLLYGGKGNDRIYGQDGNDALHGGAGDDVLGGGDGKDLLLGGAGIDRLYGGAGDDVLAGGADADWLMGNAGADTFVFRPGGGHDTVLDFQNDIDLLAFTLFGFSSKVEVLNHAYQDGSDVVIDLPDGEVVQLNSFSLALFDAGDIVI